MSTEYEDSVWEKLASFGSHQIFDPPLEQVLIDGHAISCIPHGTEKYRDFMHWWQEVGRLNPLDSSGWSTMSGPWITRGRQEAISPAQWAALPDEERALIKTWAKTIHCGVFFD